MPADALKLHDETFKESLNALPLMIWLSDAKQLFTFVNKSMREYTGHTQDDETGSDWIKRIHPDDYTNLQEQFFDSCKTKTDFTVRFRLKKDDCEFRWISAKVTPHYFQNKFNGFIGTCTEVHEYMNLAAEREQKFAKRTKELQESKEFLQSVLDTTQNLIYLYDFEKEKIVFINKKSLEATGYTSAEIEQSPTDLFTRLIHHDDLPAVLEQRRILKESPDKKMATVEFRLRNKTGQWTCQLSRDVVFKRDHQGTVLQYLSVATDISDLKKANEQMFEKNQELEYSNTELASFSSIASHDLKEPLRKIQIFSKLVLANEKNNVSPDSQTFLDRVIVSAHRMQQLIDDLISYSRTSSQKIVYTETDLNIILNQVLEDLQEIIEESKAKIEIAEMPFIPIIPSQFRQLFLNLISNSIKYSDATKLPHIRIISEKPDKKEILSIGGDPSMSYLKIVVTDNGIGFAEEFATRIFEPFQRLHGKDEYSGTGIGLAICKKIMLNHKGFITASSEEGKGATFYIYVPDGK